MYNIILGDQRMQRPFPFTIKKECKNKLCLHLKISISKSMFTNWWPGGGTKMAFTTPVCGVSNAL